MFKRPYNGNFSDAFHRGNLAFPQLGQVTDGRKGMYSSSVGFGFKGCAGS